MSRDKEPYTCEQCGQGWENLRGVDTRECSQGRCQTIICQQCQARCWACGKFFCNKHLSQTEDGLQCEDCTKQIAADAAEPQHEGHGSQCSVREEVGCDECDCGFDIAEAARRPA